MDTKSIKTKDKERKFRFFQVVFAESVIESFVIFLLINFEIRNAIKNIKNPNAILNRALKDVSLYMSWSTK